MPKPLSEKEDRLKKLSKISKPYPSSVKRDFLILSVIKDFSVFCQKDFHLVGRLMSKREHGKLIFADLLDESEKIQLVFKADALGEKVFKELKNFDIGDIIQIYGSGFTTQKGEKSILVKKYQMLAKALKPLPEKWHGIKDEETRYRQRYLDILLTPSLKEMFVKKAVFWQAMREYLVKNNFSEVETPILESTPGGADAEPFITHHNALDIDLYLRISMGELWQKRLMIANLGKTFEIGRQFRNEGIDAEHLQDYTQMEFYVSYANYQDTMKIVEDLYKYVIQKTFHTLQFKIRDFKVDFAPGWKKISFADAFKKNLHLDILQASDDDLLKKCRELKLELPAVFNRGRLMDILWKNVRKTIGGPVFLINHPVEISPLAKRLSENPKLVERYQVIIAGSEIGNGYSELNDPLDQAKRFSEQAKMRAAGDKEAQMHDQDFVAALEYGLPPTSGFGVSERLFSFLMDKPIRECVLFPLLRPKNIQSLATKTVSVVFKIKREDSLRLLKQHIKDPANFNHSLETEAILIALAAKLKENIELWGATGLLHDLDWEKTVKNPGKHALLAIDYLTEAAYPNALIQAIKAHNCELNQSCQPQNKLDFALRCGESITGLIYAAALVRPDKKLASVEVKSIKKKLKDKTFAAKVSRERILECEKIGLTLDEFIQIALSAMKNIATDIGI